MDGSERRKFKRLEIEYDILCSKVNSEAKDYKFGYTVNACSGGLFFETEEKTFEQGELLEIQLAIPPTTGLLESGGKVGGLARVLRVGEIIKTQKADNLSSNKYGVAVEFCRPLRLCI